MKIGERCASSPGGEGVSRGPKALVFDCGGYQRAHTRNCLVILGGVTPRQEPLRVARLEFPVGTQFTLLGSKQTSAGFETLDFRRCAPMRYVGVMDDELGEIALFKQEDRPTGGFFGWHPTPSGLIWGTDARAGRCIAMNRWEVLA